MKGHPSKQQAPDEVFSRRAEKKEADRMSQYRSSHYAQGMESLFGGAIKPPERGRIRF